VEEENGECPEKTKEALKKLFPIFEKLLEDAVLEVREATTTTVAKLELMLGEDFISPVRGKVKINIPAKVVE